MTITSTPAETLRNVEQVLGNGAIQVGDADSTVGFMGATPVGVQDITGARDDGTALLSLLEALVDLGLITDSTTAS